MTREPRPETHPGRVVTPVFVLAHVVALHLFVLWFLGGNEAVFGEAPPAQTTAAPLAEPEAAEPTPEPLAELDRPDRLPGPLSLDAMYEGDGRYFAELGNGWTAELTTDAALQRTARRGLDRARVPFGAVVVVDVASGDVMAMADRFDPEHEVTPELDPKGPPHLALRAFAPAASVFKIVSSVALLEAGISARRDYAFTGARRRVYAKNLEKPGKGAPKTDLGDALARSNNGFFARLADRKLDRDGLDALTRRFGFNQVIPFPLLTEASTARVPRNDLERARMAAGFWHTRLTPLHGALIAAAVAGDGTLPVPRLVRRIEGPDGRVVEAPKRPPFARVMREKHAKALRKGLRRTVTHGSGRRAFKKWPKSLRSIGVAGKTGTLATRDPHTVYTWFVGYAPADDPQVAIAVMVGNGELWWQKAADVAAWVLAQHFERQKKAAKAGDDPPGALAAR